ncbi:MAG: polysaccharide deacetylase family protein [Bacteroidota bacterium]
MLLLYSHKITKRLNYIAKHLFRNILGVEVGFTTRVEDFIKHQGPKITYTKQPLQNEFFIRSNDLLFEQGINDVQLNVQDWEGTPCFFRTDERSNIPYDIFSASFYLLSRYEEYLPHVKDELGRFPPKTSLAFQHGFLEIPVVDIWAHTFLKTLQQRFPDLSHSKPRYRFTSIVNVTISHCFALRGFGRSIGGFFLDISRFKFSRLGKRVMVWFNPGKDPYDNFARLQEIHKKFKIRTMFFFQFAAYSTHDKNISVYRNRFRYLIKAVADYSIVSLSASMAAADDVAILKEEREQLSNLINRPVKYSRMRYNRVVVPHTYRDLTEAEFTDDYSLGYTHFLGFRAGTCTPFHFYDINMELQQPIKVHPFVFSDYALQQCKTEEEVFSKLDPIYRNIKMLKGDFVMVFSNELLGSKHKIDWIKLYQSLLKRYYA